MATCFISSRKFITLVLSPVAHTPILWSVLNKLLSRNISKPIISFDNTLQISSLSVVGQPEAIYQQDELFNISSDMNMLRS